MAFGGLSEQNRLFSFDSPLGSTLLLNSFNGTEKMSELFHFDLELVSEDFNIQWKALLNRNVTVGIRLSDNSFRYFNGFVIRFEPIKHQGRLGYYKAEMVPWLWFLTQTQNCVIYQNKTVVEVIKATFDKAGFSGQYDVSKLGDRHAPWINSCQYRESAFEFISRLAEIEGIYYYFKHQQGKHTLIMVDHLSAHLPCPNQPTIQYAHDEGGGVYRGDDTITDCDMRKLVKPSKYAHKDYNFLIPKADLYHEGDVHKEVAGDRILEVYDYPGEFEWPKDAPDWGSLRQQELECDHAILSGSGTGRSMAPGYRFDLLNSPRADLDGNYLITSVTHHAHEGSFGAGFDAAPASYDNSFTSIPSSVQFRPTRKTETPDISSIQTATVVGPKGEEIYTDEYGRVKVHFHWDREPASEDSSCWIRVAQPWAGPNWGHIWIPRVGMEVMIQFLEGDPDRPVITGCLYNEENRPPYKLPDRKNWSGIMTRTTKGGKPTEFNELRFDDTQGSELYLMHAQKDMQLTVNNDTVEAIQRDRTLNVKRNQIEQVEADKNGTVKGNHNEKIGKDHSQQVGGNIAVNAGGDIVLKAQGNVCIVAGGVINLTAGGGITMSAGGGLGGLAEGLSGLAGGTLPGVPGGLPGAAPGLPTSATGAAPNATSSATGAAPSATSSATGAVPNATSSATGAVPNATSSATGVVPNATSSATGAVPNATSGATSAVTGAVPGLTGAPGGGLPGDLGTQINNIVSNAVNSAMAGAPGGMGGGLPINPAALGSQVSSAVNNYLTQAGVGGGLPISAAANSQIQSLVTNLLTSAMAGAPGGVGGGLPIDPATLSSQISSAVNNYLSTSMAGAPGGLGGGLTGGAPGSTTSVTSAQTGGAPGSVTSAPTGGAPGSVTSAQTGGAPGSVTSAPTGGAPGSVTSAPTGGAPGSVTSAQTGGAPGSVTSAPTGGAPGSVASALTGGAPGNLPGGLPGGGPGSALPGAGSCFISVNKTGIIIQGSPMIWLNCGLPAPPGTCTHTPVTPTLPDLSHLAGTTNLGGSANPAISSQGQPPAPGGGSTGGTSGSPGGSPGNGGTGGGTVSGGTTPGTTPGPTASSPGDATGVAAALASNPWVNPSSLSGLSLPNPTSLMQGQLGSLPNVGMPSVNIPNVPRVLDVVSQPPQNQPAAAPASQPDNPPGSGNTGLDPERTA